MMIMRTVKNYATQKGVTTACVYKWIKKEKVDSVKIDGVIFIIPKEDEKLL